MCLPKLNKKLTFHYSRLTDKIQRKVVIYTFFYRKLAKIEKADVTAFYVLTDVYFDCVLQQVKELMEKAIGEPIEITRKKNTNKSTDLGPKPSVGAAQKKKGSDPGASESEDGEKRQKPRNKKGAKDGES